VWRVARVEAESQPFVVEPPLEASVVELDEPASVGVVVVVEPASVVVVAAGQAAPPSGAELYVDVTWTETATFELQGMHWYTLKGPSATQTPLVGQVVPASFTGYAQDRPPFGSQSDELEHAPPCGTVPAVLVSSVELLSEEQAPIATARKAVTSKVFIAAEPTHPGQRCRHAIDTDV
jgi:hypothetical protein